MAYQVSYWKAEGKSDIELKSIRIKKLADIEYYRLKDSRPQGTSIVLLERTDRQSPNCRTLWHDVRYVPLDKR